MKKDAIEKAIADALLSLGVENVRFDVDYPPKGTDADYATNAALSAGKELGKDPKEVAGVLADALSASEIPGVLRVETAGPGFVNIFLARDAYVEVVRAARERGTAWGEGEEFSGRTILVEHTQPNPFKPFHIGHLMSNALGESVARLLRFAGAKVLTANYQGDVGLHVAKALWAVEKNNTDPEDVAALGEAYAFGNTAYEESEEAKAEIVALNKRLYAGDEALEPLYKKGRDASLAHFEELYRLLGSSFDMYFFESEVWKPGAALVEEGKARGVFEESDGAVVYRGEKAGLHTRVFLTREGLPTYEAKELGLAAAKAKWQTFDLSLTTTAVEQQEYFRVVFAALAELRPEWSGKFRHIAHGMMLLPSGKMSSRKGNVVTGESLIEDTVAEVREKMGERELADTEKTAGVVAVAAIKYAILKQSAGKNIVFDKERALSLEGDSGPYLQYAHTRCSSILKKAKEEGVTASMAKVPAEVSEPERLLLRFPEAAARAAKEYEPHHVAQYLTELAASFNSWYASERVLDGTLRAAYKLAVVDAVRQTLRNGLYLLGCEAPEEM